MYFLKNDGVNLLMQKIIYTPMSESDENTAMSATELRSNAGSSGIAGAVSKKFMN